MRDISDIMMFWRSNQLLQLNSILKDIRPTGFITLVLSVKPDQVTLVPDPHDAITSNAGWDTLKNRIFLTDIVSTFRKEGIRTSLFVDTNPVNIENAALTGTDRVELYTEPYATGFNQNAIEAVDPFIRAAEIGT